MKKENEVFENKVAGTSLGLEQWCKDMISTYEQIQEGKPLNYSLPRPDRTSRRDWFQMEIRGL